MLSPPSSPRSSPPPCSPNFMFSVSPSLPISPLKQNKKYQWKQETTKLQIKTVKRPLRQKKSQKKAKWNKESIKIPLSSFCIDQLLLGMGPALDCGLKYPSETPLDKMDFPFANR